MRLSYAIPAATALCLFLSIGLIAYPIYREARSELGQRQTQSLLGLTRSTSALLDGDLHEDLFLEDDGQLSDPEAFLLLKNQLDKVRSHARLRGPIYTMRPAWDYDQTGEFEFIVMTDLKKGQPYVGNRMIPNSSILRCYQTAESIATPYYSDSEGTWASAVSPIRASNGEVVAVLLADRDAEDYSRDLAHLRHNMLFRCGVALVVSLLGARFLLGRYLRRFEMIRKAVVSTQEGQRKRADDTGRDEISEVAQAINGMVDSLERQALEERRRVEAETKAQAKSDLLSSMSHEIRTPLNAILGHVELLCAEDGPPAEWPGPLLTVDRCGRHLSRILNDVLDLSKIEAGKLAILPREFSPKLLVEDVRTLLRARASERGNTITTSSTARVPAYVTTDPDRICQALMNLVGNAIKFTENGIISIDLDADTDQQLLLLTVVDSGIGLSEEQIERLFQPFSQADPNVTREFGGTGLGLTISRSLAELMGGSINVVSEPGHGSRFTLSLRAEPVSVHADSGGPRIDEVQSVELVGRFLVVDDVADNRTLARCFIEKSGGEVVEAGDGLQALEILRREVASSRQFDAVLMDLQMPILDGLAATRQLREEGFDVPVIALTASVSREDASRCLEAGCNRLERKPVSRSRLVSTIQAAVRDVEIAKLTQ